MPSFYFSLGTEYYVLFVPYNSFDENVDRSQRNRAQGNTKWLVYCCAKGRVLAQERSLTQLSKSKIQQKNTESDTS